MPIYSISADMEKFSRYLSADIMTGISADSIGRYQQILSADCTFGRTLPPSGGSCVLLSSSLAARHPILKGSVQDVQ